MLDPWIIEQIREREQKRRKDSEAQRIHVPRLEPMPEELEPKAPIPSDRGVVVIDL